MKIKKATYNDFSKIQEFLTLIFPKDDPNYYSGFLYYDQLFTPDRVFYIEDSGKIVSTLWSIPRVFKDKDAFILSVGIANVGTHPDYRGKGYASDLIDYAVSTAKDENVDMIILVTEIPEYYRKYGFINLGRVSSTFSSNIKRNHKIIIEEANLEEVSEISSVLYKKYNLITPLRNYGILKSEALWNKFSSHFIYNKNIANWFKISLSGKVKLYTYALEKDDFYEMFEIIFDSDLEKDSIKMILEALSYIKGKPLQIFTHKVIFDMLEINFKADSEVVMGFGIKPVDLDRVYLPIVDYF